MTKQELANNIWKTAEELRGEIEANNYKDFILGFLFYKYLSDNLFSFMINQGASLDDYIAVTKGLKDFDFDSVKNEELVKLCLMEQKYFIPYEYSYKAWISKDYKLTTDTLSKALDFFEDCTKDNLTYENIFRQLRNNINILGKDNSTISTKIEKIAFIFKDLDFSIQKDFDLVGYIYEYLISMFASNAGKKAGEFYTPHEVSVLISEVIAHYLKDTCNEIKLYDPTCGSGSLLITMGKAVKKHYEKDIKIHYYGQEKIQTTYDLARMNLTMTGTDTKFIHLKNADTLLSDWPCENGDALRVNAIAANPPYSANWQRDNATSDPRFSYGLAPNKKADFAFLQHSLYHLKNNGLMGIVLPHGVLFRSGAEEEIRKNLIENNHIYAIVGLPANIFYGTSISTIVMFLTNDITRSSDILFIDASCEFIKDGKKNKLQSSNIKKIFDCLIARENKDNFARLVSKDEVIANNYNLNITRYISKANDLELDFNALMFGGIPKKDLDKKYFDSLKSLRNDIFKNYDDEYLRFNDFSNLKEQILNSKDIKNYELNYKTELNNYKEFLKSNLIDKIDLIDTNKIESILNNPLEQISNNYELFDKYKMYQKLIDRMGGGILNDIDSIQRTNLKEFSKTLDLEIIKNEFFSTELQELSNLANHKENIYQELNELKDELDESYLKDNGDLDEKLIKAEYKMISKTTLDNDELNIIKINEKLKDYENAKKSYNTYAKELDKKSLQKQNELNIDEIKTLLNTIWIEPIISNLLDMFNAMCDEIANKLRALNDIYKDTLNEIENDLKQSNAKVCELLAELDANTNEQKAINELIKILG